VNIMCNTQRTKALLASSPSHLARRSMYGLLQLLPQSDAFKTLHARLHSAPTLALLSLQSPGKGSSDGAPLPSQTRWPRMRSETGSAKGGNSDAAAGNGGSIPFDQLLELFRQRQVVICRCSIMMSL